jgi:hypothetical protein
MKIKITLIGVVTSISMATFSDLKATTIDLPLYGFQIDSLDAKADSSPAKALIMFLPESDGFQPNINVLIQPFNGTIKDYVVLSKGQFEQLQYKVISEHLIGDNGWSFEYSGPTNGHDIHCYAQAVSKNGKVYLATATAKESQWAAVGDTLRKHIDGFKAD